MENQIYEILVKPGPISRQINDASKKLRLILGGMGKELKPKGMGLELKSFIRGLDGSKKLIYQESIWGTLN